jgi:hypothetical protein
MKPPRRATRWPGFSLVVLAACSGAGGSPDETQGGGAFLAFANDFSGYHSWEAFDVTEGAAATGIHDGSTLTAYLSHRPESGSDAFPVGTMIVKEPTGGTEPPHIFAMAKRGAGYNANVPGWEWFELENLVTAATAFGSSGAASGLRPAKCTAATPTPAATPVTALARMACARHRLQSAASNTLLRRPHGPSLLRRRTRAALFPFTLALATESHANPRPLPFTYQHEQLGSGESELEQFVDLTPVRAYNEGSGQPAWYGLTAFQTEFEHGISDRLELGLYLTFVPGAASGFTNVPRASGGTGLKQRLRYQLAPSGEWPIDVGVYGEIAETEREVEFEAKVILQRRLGRVRLIANVTAEEEIYYDGKRDFVLAPPRASPSNPAQRYSPASSGGCRANTRTKTPPPPAPSSSAPTTTSARRC